MFDDILGNSKKKGPKTAKGKMRKALTGDGRKKSGPEKVTEAVMGKPKKTNKKSKKNKGLFDF